MAQLNAIEEFGPFVGVILSQLAKDLKLPLDCSATPQIDRLPVFG